MRPIFNRAPLTPNTLSPLPMGSIRPEDWLKEQLSLQADTLKGRLDEIWPEDPASCTEWDLTGLIALAWALDDAAMKARAEAYIEWMIASKRDDGWFGAVAEGDYWRMMQCLKSLKLYFTATGDKRVLTLMSDYFKYQYVKLATAPMQDWAVARGGENMAVALWLYNITGQKHLLELCRKLKAQTLDWTSFFHTFANTVPMSKSLKWERLGEALKDERSDELSGEKRPYFRTQYHFSHGVNIAMALKTPGVVNLFKSGFKEQSGFRFGYEKLMKHHGVANGMFTCDEHLSGSSPVQGVEIGAIAALMESLEAQLGLAEFDHDNGAALQDCADALEKVAYNALPAAFTADMSAQQACQQVNQVKVSRETRRWYNEDDNANLFTDRLNPDKFAEVMSAWPMFTASQWYATADGGVQAISYAPCTVRTVLDNVPVRIRVRGGYPFAQSVEIEVSVKQPCEFPLHLRVPGWARQPMIYLPDGEIMQVRAGEVTCVRRRWRTGDTVRVELPTMPRVSRWYHQSGAVELGPLLMAYQPEEIWETQPEGRQVIANEPWNWALVREEPMKVVYGKEAPRAFGLDDTPVTVKVKAVPVDWSMDGASAASVPMVPKVDVARAQVLYLVPYGETALRIAQFPMGRLPGEKN